MPLTTIANYYLDSAIQSTDFRNSGDFVASGDIAANSFVTLNSDGTVTSIQNKYSSGITSFYGLNNQLTPFFSGLSYSTYKVNPQSHRLANGNIIIFFKNGTNDTDNPAYVIFNSSTNTVSSIVSMASNGTSHGFPGTGSDISPNRENAAFASRFFAVGSYSVEFFTYNQTSNSSTRMALNISSLNFDMPRVCYINDLTIFGIVKDNSTSSFIVQTYDLSGNTLTGPTTFSYSSLGLGTNPTIVDCRGLAGGKALLLVDEGSILSLIYGHATDTFSAPTTVQSTFDAIYGGMTRLSTGNIMYFYQDNNDKISRLDTFDSAGNVVAAGVPIFDPDVQSPVNFNRVLQSPSGDIYLIFTQTGGSYSTYLVKVDSSGNLLDSPKIMIKYKSLYSPGLYADIINDSSILFGNTYGNSSYELVTDLEPYVVIGYVEQAVTSGNSAKVFLNEQVLTTSLSGNSRINYYIQSNGTLSTAPSRFPAGKSFGSKLVLGKE